VRLAGAFVGRGGAVATQHHARLPAGEPHQVGLVAAVRQPQVREGVPELVGVQALDAGLPAAPAKDLGDARLGDPAGPAEPQPVQVGVLVVGANSQLAVERLGSAAAERQRPLPAGFAEYVSHLQVEVQIADPHPGDLGPPWADVDQEED
jgi:hypothetical protein